MSIWRRYAREHPRTLQKYDLGEPGSPNLIAESEICRTRIIGSRMSDRQGRKLINRAAEAGCPWQNVTESASLADADPALPGGLFDQASDLYWYFLKTRIPHVRVAKVHKILHIKRPDLYPILDKRLKGIYRKRAKPWVNELRRLNVSIDDSPPYWAAIRQDLLASDAALTDYRSQLAEESDDVVRQMARLSNLRLLDILAWRTST